MRYVFYTTANADLAGVANGASGPVKKIWIHDDAHAASVLRSVLDFSAVRPDEVFVEDAFSFSDEPLMTLRPSPRRFSAATRAPRLPKVAFFADSDTIATTLLPVIQRIAGRMPMAVFTSATKNEGAPRVFEAHQIDYEILSAAAFTRAQPDVLVVANDWSTEGKMLLALCRRMGVASVCLQESVIHFNDPRMRRMQRAGSIMLQGAFTTKFLLRENTFITGNPRYEMLDFLPQPPRPRAFINCNFTYGVYEDQRAPWLRAVTGTLDRLGIDYLISQHPRDFGDLSAFRNVLGSNAGVVHEQLAACSFVVSRFSSVMHEALCLGRNVVYFNPHDETLNYDFGFDDAVIFRARDAEALRRSVEMITAHPYDETAFGRYLLLHCKSLNQPPSALIAGLLQHARFDAADALQPNLPASMFKYLYRRALKNA